MNIHFVVSTLICTSLWIQGCAFGRNVRFRSKTRPILTHKAKLTTAELNVFLPYSIPMNRSKSGSYNGGGVMAINKHIVGGTVSSRGQFPYQAALVMNKDWFCGGSLITVSHILTAAHCSEGATSFAVTLGAQDRDANEVGRVVLESKRAAIHAGYNADTVLNDISIIYLPTSVKTSNFIKLIRLPRQTSKQYSFYLGQTATISGWGRLGDDKKNVSSIMYNLKMKVVSLLDCVNLYGRDSVSPSNMCVNGRGNMQGTCNGDSGGPLVIRETDGSLVQIGIVSYGAAAGCDAGYPDVFTRVTSYLPWISTRTSANLRNG